MLKIFLAIAIFLISVDRLGSSLAAKTLSQQLKEFSYKGHESRTLQRRFIKSIRRRLIHKPPLSERRVSELILYTELSVAAVNNKIKLTPWYQDHPITIQEVLEAIAAANMFQNIIAQQKWEALPNFGYMDLRPETALNALWDMGIQTLYGRAVPRTLHAYKKDPKFREWLKALLVADPYVNILCGTWTLCKGKNWADGSFQKTVAYYTMGARSYHRQLKKEPKSQGLVPVAWGYHKRWQKWHRVWTDIGNPEQSS